MAGRDRGMWLTLEVQDVQHLTPGLVRVTLGGEELAEYGADQYTDHYTKLVLPPKGADYAPPFDQEEIKATRPKDLWPIMRTYTVSSWDAASRQITIDFVVHGDEGIAGPWAAAAKPGDLLQLSYPGGAYTPSPDADWHLLAGDSSVIPAISASLERVPAGIPAHVFIEVDGPEEEVPLQSPGDLHLTWLHRSANTGDPDDLLAGAVRDFEFPDGNVHAFVHGEASAVRALRKYLLGDLEVPRESVSISGYWKRRLTEDGWRENKKAWLAEAEADLEKV
ncbi:MAG TPA: siderophore-interacting protein [Baekduia sp.]|nr:siderophore-interacting protein [Baekduia sp.]